MEFLPTKGIEYLLVMGYLLLVIACWRVVCRRTPAETKTTGYRAGDWFDVPDGLHFHRGHTWAVAESADTFRVGLDDFARRLIGRPDALVLPATGDRIEQGETGWQDNVDGGTLELLSPIRGEVVEVNDEAVRTPDLVSSDPYGRGWLLKVRSSQPSAVERNLLSGKLARAWMEEAAQRIRAMIGREPGVVLQDGGDVITGFGRELAPGGWHGVAAELLLTAKEEN